MLHLIERYIHFPALKEELKKIGVNFITAGIVGIFIQHYAGTNLLNMFSASVCITIVGTLALYGGIRKQGEK